MERAIQFDNWLWNPNTLELRNGAHVVSLEPRIAQLFEYLLTHPGELLSHDRIVTSVWDGRVVSDEAVRKAVSGLRQALTVDGADGYIRTIHKKGYQSTFPKYVVVEPDDPEAATIDSSTPPTTETVTPLRESPERAHPHGTASSRLSKWIRIVGAVAVVLAVLSRIDALWEREHAVPQNEKLEETSTTLAVLPFRNLSDEPDTEFLALGLAEELQGTLARHKDLRITARSSAFQLKDQNQDVRDVGQRLGVRYVLEGSIRKSAEQVRINARLIDAQTGMQLWSEGYDRNLDDWFALQQNVAMEVATALDSVLPTNDSNPNRAETESVDAHLEVLRARQLLASRSVTDAEQAIEHLQRALTLDPDYALAYARLADAMLIQAESTTGMPAARPTVAPLLDKAIALDPGLGEAYALRSQLTDDPTEAERELRKGLELNPSYARGYELLASLQSRALNKLELALHTIDRAIALDPLTPGNYDTKAGMLGWVGDWAGAETLYRRALALNPDFRSAVAGLGQAAAIQGNFAEAIQYTERAVALDPRAPYLRDYLAHLYLLLGDSDSALTVTTPPTPFAQIGTLWSKGEIGLLADLIYSHKLEPLGLFPAEYLAQIVLLQALSDQDYVRALNLLETTYQVGNSVRPTATGWYLYAYANRVQLLAASGDGAAASHLQAQLDARMDAIESQIPRHAKLYNQIRATLLAHAGHSEEACAVFNRSFTPAPGPRWKVVLGNPAFDNMRDAPCFQDLLMRLEAHTAAERAKLEVMRHAGLIPDRSKLL
jgi:TolB-like protein/DNA-binding winged helix-turn-helix (wHTH) protein